MSEDQEAPDIKEESMVEPDFSEGNVADIVTALPIDLASDSIKSMLQAVNLSSDGVYHEPTCPLCNCINRGLYEEKWLETKCHDDIRALAKQKNDQQFSNAIIDNHMRYHYEHGIEEQKKLEFIDKINRLNNTQISTLDRVRNGLSAIMLRVVNINSLTPTGSMDAAQIEKTQSSETTKLMSSYTRLLQLQASILGEMKKEGDLIQIPKQTFVEFFNRSILNAKTDEERKIIKDLLEELTSLGKIT